MKKLLLCLIVCLTPAAFTACSTAPVSQNVQVQTLLAVGQSAEATVRLAAHLYQAGTITAAQLKAVDDFYDLKFQPAYGAALALVEANQGSIAPDNIVSLGLQLSNLLLKYRNHTS